MARLKPITEEQRAIQREFFQLDEKTMDRVRRLKPRLMDYAKTALDGVFDHLEGNPEVAHYFEISENVTYLRAGMLAHCDTLFSCRFDDAYYDATDHMGERHSKLEYHSHVYTAAYTNMFTRIVELAMADKGKFTTEDIVALTRVTLYDMELTVGSFFSHRMEKRDALDSDAVKIRHLLTGS
jgi:hypothetical protein